VIDATGMHVYPGLVLPNAIVGLEEISAVQASADYEEVGEMNPHVRALIAYNTDSDLIPTMRFNGIALAQTTPQGELLTGSSSVVQLDAWNWEDAAYRADDGLHLNWPARMMRPRWWMGEVGMRPNPDYDKTVGEIEGFFREAQAYHAAKPEKTNLRFEAMKGLLNGSQTLYIHVNKAKDIVASCRMARQWGVQRVVVVGGYDAWLVADYLKEAQIAVILPSIHNLPARADDPADLPFRLPALLQQAGVKFCLGFDGEMLANARNLPFYAGTAIAHGLTPEQALQAVTSSAAEILGIADRAGKLAVGLDAHIAVCQGDLFDMRGNRMAYLFIQGRATALEDKQQALYEQYKAKYGQGR
jgi:hypothetical protein